MGKLASRVDHGRGIKGLPFAATHGSADGRRVGNAQRGTRGGTPTLPEKRPTEPMLYEELWDITAVANYLGVPKQTIYKWQATVRPGRLPRGEAPALACRNGHRMDAQPGDVI